MTDYEQEYRDLRAGVEALRDEWLSEPTSSAILHPQAAVRLMHLLASSAPATASEGAREGLRRAVGVRLAQEFERKNASQKPDVYMADTWLFAADAALDVIAARPTREEFRARVRNILVDRAALDEHIEEFFDEVLDDIVEAHLSHPTLATGVTSSDGDRGVSEALAEMFAEHDEDPGWTVDDNDRPVYECQCGDRSPTLDKDAYIGSEDVEAAARWHRLHLAHMVERILAARTAQPEGVERVDWGVRDWGGDVIYDRQWSHRDDPRLWMEHNGYTLDPLKLVRRTVTEFAPVIGEWEVVGDE